VILDGAPLRVWNLSQAQEKLGIGGDFVATSYTSVAPTGGTAAPWKLGDIVAGAVVPDATRYVLVEIGGVPVKLIVAA
jgi:hypothetical protein